MITPQNETRNHSELYYNIPHGISLAQQYANTQLSDGDWNRSERRNNGIRREKKAAAIILKLTTRQLNNARSRTIIQTATCPYMDIRRRKHKYAHRTQRKTHNSNYYGRNKTKRGNAPEDVYTSQIQKEKDATRHLPYRLHYDKIEEKSNNASHRMKCGRSKILHDGGA